MEIEELRQAGFSDQEINSYINNQSTTLSNAGFTKEEIKGYLERKEEEGVGIGENIWRTAVGALRDVGQGTIDFTDWIESKIPTALQAGLVKTEEDGYQVLTGKEYVNAKESLRSKGIKSINLPKVPEPEYFGGSFIRDLTGFIIPFSKLKLLNPTSVLGKGTEIVARGTLAEQLAFSPFEQRLSNLAAEYGPEFSKPLANYLKADINDTESEARFKMAIEGTILGGTIESVIALAKSVKNMRSVGKKEGVKIKQEQPDVKDTKTLKKQIEDLNEPFTEKVRGVKGKDFTVDVDIPVRDAPQPLKGQPISPTTNWKPQWYRNLANKIIDYTSQKTAWYKPMGLLPKSRKFEVTRGLFKGKLETVEGLVKSNFKKFSKLTELENLQVYKYLTKELPLKKINLHSITDAAERIKANKIIQTDAQHLKRAIDKIANIAVKQRILTQKQIKPFKNAYLPRMFLNYIGKHDFTKLRKQDLDDFTKQFLGEIKDVGILGAEALQKPLQRFVRQDFLDEIAKEADWVYKGGLIKWENRNVSPVWLKEQADRISKEIRDKTRTPSEIPTARAMVNDMNKLVDQASKNIEEAQKDLSLFEKLPDTNYFGSLKGAYVRKEIANDLVLSRDFGTNKKGLAQAILGDAGTVTKATRLWKFSKVALNPPTQVRNFVSNVILLNLSGVRWVDMPKRFTAAIDDIRKNGPFTQIAKKYGVNNTTFSKQEMIQINKAYLKMKAAKGNFVDKMKYMGGSVGDLGTRSYQFTELLGKTVKIMDEMAKGVSEADAVLAAQKTLFDYSLIPPSVRYLRNAPVGMPFITFYYKVLPNLLETAIRNPERFLPYVAVPYAYHAMLAKYQGVTKEDFDALKKTLPEYLRDRGDALIMPVKDDAGRWQAFDFSYFLPWSMFKGAIKDAADGDVQRFFVDTGILGGPLPQLITAVLANKDPFTNREIHSPYDPPATQAADMMMYLWRMSMPTWLTDIGFAGRMKQALDKDVNKYGDPKITMTQAALRLVGMNVYPVDAQKSRYQNIKNMKYELQQIKSRRTKTLKDRNLTQEERDKIRKKYNDLIKQRIDQLREYREESTIPKELR